MVSVMRVCEQLERRTGQSASAGQVVGLHAWAMMERREGNWAAARTLLEVAQRVSPGNAIVLQSRAMLEAEVHHWAEARLFFKAATEADPSDVSCWQVGPWPWRRTRGETLRGSHWWCTGGLLRLAGWFCPHLCSLPMRHFWVLQDRS